MLLTTIKFAVFAQAIQNLPVPEFQASGRPSLSVSGLRVLLAERCYKKLQRDRFFYGETERLCLAKQ